MSEQPKPSGGQAPQSGQPEGVPAAQANVGGGPGSFAALKESVAEFETAGALGVAPGNIQEVRVPNLSPPAVTLPRTLPLGAGDAMESEAVARLADVHRWLEAVATEDRPGYVRDESWKQAIVAVGMVTARGDKIIVAAGDRLHAWALERLGPEWVGRRMQIGGEKRPISAHGARMMSHGVRLVIKSLEEGRPFDRQILSVVADALDAHAEASSGKK